MAARLVLQQADLGEFGIGKYHPRNGAGVDCDRVPE